MTSVHEQLLEMERADRIVRARREAKQSVAYALLQVQTAYGETHPAVQSLVSALEALKEA